MSAPGRARLRLLQLASPALPIGAFAHSQGLEHAVTAGWVRDEATAADWILGLLAQGLGHVDLPLLLRLQAAWAAGDDAAVRRWSGELHALRGSRELQEEERRLGSALARALDTLGVPGAAAFVADPRASYVAMFACAAGHYGAAPEEAAEAYAFAWCETQIAAALRLVPLGQSSGLRIADRAIALIPEVGAVAARLADDEVGFGAPALAIGSALHETQYSRIFRS